MMEQCKICVFYDPEFDAMSQSDVVIDGVDVEERNEHFCSHYRQGIPTKIIEGKQECYWRIGKDLILPTE